MMITLDNIYIYIYILVYSLLQGLLSEVSPVHVADDMSIVFILRLLKLKIDYEMVLCMIMSTIYR